MNSRNRCTSPNGGIYSRTSSTWKRAMSPYWKGYETRTLKRLISPKLRTFTDEILTEGQGSTLLWRDAPGDQLPV